MPRRGKISKRDVLPDPLYNSKLVTKLVNNIMLDGKKGVAQKIVYDAFAIVEAKQGQNALETFEAALENIMPVLDRHRHTHTEAHRPAPTQPTGCHPLSLGTPCPSSPRP